MNEVIPKKFGESRDVTEVSGISPRVCGVVPNILWKERRVPRVSRMISEWFR